MRQIYGEHTPKNSYFLFNCHLINHLFPQPERFLINAASFHFPWWELPLQSGNEPVLNQSSPALCPATFLHATVRLEMRRAGGFFWRGGGVITHLPLSYFSLLSVIALAWNVVHGAFTRSISHAEEEYLYHRAATDRLMGWWDNSSEHRVSSVEEGRKTNLSQAVK